MTRRAGHSRSYTGAVLAVVITVVLLAACSDKRTNPTLPETHPDVWLQVDATDFHGNVVQVNGGDGCKECHGDDFDGGRSDISCIECHQTLTDLCIRCHGGVDNTTGAPPVGLEGETADTALAVGAHTVHLEGGMLFDGGACDNCHKVPAYILDSAHIGGDNIAELTWGGIAAAPGVSWDRQNRTCTNTYCHGNFSGGYHSTAPTWTGSNQAACGSCHDNGVNPIDLGWKHEVHLRFFVDCDMCHAGIGKTNGPDTVFNRALHVNGVIDTMTTDTSTCNICHEEGRLSCTGCHGGVDNQSGAPPRGIDGELSSTTIAVGAHTAHVDGGPFTDGVPCEECHIYPETFGTPGHYDFDSTAELIWGPLATGTEWNRATATCQNSYCHGEFDGGDRSNDPVWTAADQAQCGSCHAEYAQPILLSGRHKEHVTDLSLPCAVCHSTVMDISDNFIGPDLHVDGQVNINFLEGGNYSGGTCSGLGSGCHGSESWFTN